jgi:hypothetical protein
MVSRTIENFSCAKETRDGESCLIGPFNKQCHIYCRDKCHIWSLNIKNAPFKRAKVGSSALLRPNQFKLKWCLVAEEGHPKIIKWNQLRRLCLLDRQQLFILFQVVDTSVAFVSSSTTIYIEDHFDSWPSCGWKYIGDRTWRSRNLNDGDW